MRIDQGTIDDPSLAWLDTLWLIAYGLYLLAAMHPSIRNLGRAETDDDPPISRGRLALSGLTLLAPIVALVIAGTELSHLLVAVGAEAVLVVLVLLRLSDLAAGERRARQAVLDRERYFRSLVQNSSEAMVVLDADGVVRDASPAVRTLLEVAPADLVGHRPGEAVPGIDRRAMESMLQAAVATPGEVITGEVLVEHQRRHPVARDANQEPARGIRRWRASWSTSTTSRPGVRSRSTSSGWPSPTR